MKSNDKWYQQDSHVAIFGAAPGQDPQRTLQEDNVSPQNRHGIRPYILAESSQAKTAKLTPSVGVRKVVMYIISYKSLC